jgi:hypothetical protein
LVTLLLPVAGANLIGCGGDRKQHQHSYHSTDQSIDQRDEFYRYLEGYRLRQRYDDGFNDFTLTVN